VKRKKDSRGNARSNVGMLMLTNVWGFRTLSCCSGGDLCFLKLCWSTCNFVVC
jgi:hypothetical protein